MDAHDANEPDGGAAARRPEDAGASLAAPLDGAAEPLSAAVGALLADELPSLCGALGSSASPHVSASGNRGRAGRSGQGRRPYHPAPRIVIDVSSRDDGALAADLQRTARNLGYWPVRRCYEGGLRRDQRLAGKVLVAMTVSPDGAVETAAVIGSTLSDPIVAACIARELASAAFGPMKAEAAARAEVSLSAGDDPVFVPASIPDADRMRQALRASWPAAARCYAQDLAADPRSGGRIELHVRVSREGAVVDVTSAQESDGHFAANTTPCVIAAYHTATLVPFSAPGAERAFVYALQFESGPAPSAP
jgi:hypothetical protein